MSCPALTRMKASVCAPRQPGLAAPAPEARCRGLLAHERPVQDHVEDVAQARPGWQERAHVELRALEIERYLRPPFPAVLRGGGDRGPRQVADDVAGGRASGGDRKLRANAERAVAFGVERDGAGRHLRRQGRRHVRRSRAASIAAGRAAARNIVGDLSGTADARRRAIPLGRAAGDNARSRGPALDVRAFVPAGSGLGDIFDVVLHGSVSVGNGLQRGQARLARRADRRLHARHAAAHRRRAHLPRRRHGDGSRGQPTQGLRSAGGRATRASASS